MAHCPTVTLEALQLATQMGQPPAFRCHPGTELPGRIMAYMLKMATGKLSYPVPVFIKMIACNGAEHRRLISHENYCTAEVNPAWPP